MVAAASTMAMMAILSLPLASHAQLSLPIVDDDSFLSKLTSRGKEFRERTAKEIEGEIFATDHSAWKPKTECEVDAELLWTAESGERSSIRSFQATCHLSGHHLD